MPATKPVFLASDVHFGATSPEREQAFLAWLDHAGASSSWIILNGDLFDFWFEFRRGVPRGYEALLGRLAEIVSSGVPITLMGGNHDWWGGRYLREEIGVEFLQDPVAREIAGRRSLLAHGDGLGAGDVAYRFLVRPLLRSPVTRFAFGLLPVAVGERIAGQVSHTDERRVAPEPRQIERSEALEAWATSKLTDDPELELVLLGHTHLPMLKEVAPGRWYVNSGDWVVHRSYVTLTRGRDPVLREWGEAGG